MHWMSRLYVQTRWAEVELVFSSSGRSVGLAERIDDCANHGGRRPKRDRQRVKRLAKERMRLREMDRGRAVTKILRQPFDFDPRDPVNKAMEKWGEQLSTTTTLHYSLCRGHVRESNPQSPKLTRITYHQAMATCSHVTTSDHKYMNSGHYFISLFFAFCADANIMFRTGMWFEVQKKYLSERDFMQRLFEDPTYDDLVEFAHSMPNEDQRARLHDLEVRRAELNFKKNGLKT